MSSNSPQKKRIVIAGAAGRLGGLLGATLERDHEIIRLARPELDLGSAASIAAALEPLDYDMVAITGALTAVDYCETHRDEAFAVNADGPGEIARISAAKGAHVTYISTDFVYEGTKPGLCTEEDAVNPVSVYGASKLGGEEQVLAASPANLVARVSWLYGPGRPAFPEWIIRKACEETALTLPGDKTGCPTSSIDLVAMLQALLFNGPAPASGIFNLCNSNPCTWREWGQFCIDTARDAGLPVMAEEIAGVPLDSVAAFVAKRPANSSMAVEKFAAAAGIRPRDWREAVRDFLHQSDLFRELGAAAV